VFLPNEMLLSHVIALKHLTVLHGIDRAVVLQWGYVKALRGYVSCFKYI